MQEFLELLGRNSFELDFEGGFVGVGGFVELVKFFGDDVVDVFEGFVDFFEGDFPVDGTFLVTGLDSL